MYNKNKGITLIALVITIIILLILAGVVIASLTQNGLLQKLKQAKKDTEDAQNREESILNEYEKAIAGYESKGENQEKISADMVAFTPEDPNWKVENVKEALDYLYNN
ncbi:unknown [Clostridium sp. CAG:575]|nr:unknown [Clostridium sp. CAG:575]